MKAHKILFTAALLLATVLNSSGALAQVCSQAFVSAVSSIEKVEKVTGEKGVFLAILDTNDRKQALKIRAAVKTILKSHAGTCDFSDNRVVMVDNSFQRLGKGFPAPVSDRELEDRLYNYVYGLSPVDVDTNLKGYQELVRLSPANNYYKARLEHYKNRKELYQARKVFTREALKAAGRDERIEDLKLQREFCLIVTDTETPVQTANRFMKEVLKKVPALKRKPCIFIYGPDLKKAGEDCPEWANSAKAAKAEARLLRSYVLGLPSYEIRKNLAGYKELSRMVPRSSLYKSKVDFYSSKLNGLEKFSALETVSGSPLFKTSGRNGAQYQVELSRNVLQGLSGKAEGALYKSLASYYQHNGAPLSRCEVFRDGRKAGVISCDRNGRCSFKSSR